MSAQEEHDSDLGLLQRFVAAEASRPADVVSASEQAEKDAMRDRLAATLGIAMVAAGTATAPLAGTTSAPPAIATSSWPVWTKALILLSVGFGAGFGVRSVLATSSAGAPVLAPASSPTTTAMLPPTAVPLVPSAKVTETIDVSNLPLVPASTASGQGAATAKTSAKAGVPADAEAERLLLETARVALRRGDREGALRLLQEHRAKFPQGQLREERDGLMVSALQLLGRGDEAAKAAARFHKDYPMSLQGAAMPESPDAGR